MKPSLYFLPLALFVTLTATMSQAAHQAPENAIPLQPIPGPAIPPGPTVDGGAEAGAGHHGAQLLPSFDGLNIHGLKPAFNVHEFLYQSAEPIHKTKLLAELPTNSAEALQYLFTKINSAESTVAVLRTLELQLQLVDRLPEPGLTSVDPVFDPSGKLVMRVSLLRSQAENPVAALEALSQILSLTSSEDLLLQASSKQVIGYPEYVYLKDKDGHYILDKHHNVQIDHKHTKWTHYHEWISQSVLRALGLRVTPVINGRSPMGWAELKLNATNGSRLASREFAEFQVISARAARDSFSSFELFKRLTGTDQLKTAILKAAAAQGYGLDVTKSEAELWSDYSAAHIARLEARMAEKTKAAQAELREHNRLANDPEKKALKDRLEDMPKKLEALVKENNREGVAQLLEAFLPFESMEPVEKSMWRDWIEAIRHPDLAKSIVLYRGLDDKNDLEQTALDAHGKPIGYGFFSTLLTRNQGNYTRRLRSVATMRTRFGVPNGKEVSPLISTPKLSEMMYNHSGNPTGSPFLSFTISPQTAYAFAEDAYIVVRIDSRRVLPNVVSSFTNEVEMLVPMIVFPDEVITYERVGKRSEANRVSLTGILQRASQKLGYDLAAVKVNKSFTHQTFQSAYKMFSRVQLGLSGGGLCADAFR